jgi:monoamine oxidase
MSKFTVSRRSFVKAGAASLAIMRMPALAASPKNIDAIILGAGISGLHAARMLQNAGLTVLVLEGSGRIGGRCWTARNAFGAPELGAQQIGFGFGRVRGNAADLGVALIDPPKGSMSETNMPTLSVSIGDAAPTKDWPRSSLNRLREDEKSFPPTALLTHYLFKDNPLSTPTDWQKPEFEWIERLSLREYLAQKGASAEALRLIDVGVAARNLDDANALDFLRKNYYYAWEGKNGPYSIFRDGTSALTDAMAASLHRPVILNKIVTRIDAGSHSVAVKCKDGSTYLARTCITTIPLSVMKDIAITGDVPPLQRDAWRQQRYSNTLEVFFKFREPFWDKDGLPANMWTDAPMQFLAHIPSRVEPVGNLVAYCHGEGLEALAGLSAAAIGQRCVEHIVRLRPAAAGQLSVDYVHDWSRYPFSKGHIAYFAPGDVGRYASIVARPVGALYFAGEHNCRVHAGVEGACEAAENASIAVLETLSKG